LGLVERCRGGSSTWVFRYFDPVDEQELLRDWADIPEVRRILKGFLDSENQSEFTVAAGALLALDPPDADAVDGLWKRFEHAKYLREVLRWGTMLLEIVSHSGCALSRVCAQLAHEEPTAVRQVLRWLSEHDLPTLPLQEVRPLLEHDDPGVRFATARLLLKWEDGHQAVEALTRLLHSDQEFERYPESDRAKLDAREVVRALVPFVRRPDVREALRHALVSADTHPWARLDTAMALLKSGDRAEIVVEATERVIRSDGASWHDCYYHFSVETRVDLAEALADSGFAEVAADALVDTCRRIRAEREAAKEAAQQTECPPHVSHLVLDDNIVYERWQLTVHERAAEIVGEPSDRARPVPVVNVKYTWEPTVAKFLYARGLQMDFADELVNECTYLGCGDWDKVAAALEHAPRRDVVINRIYRLLARDERNADRAAKILCQWGLRTEAISLLREQMSRPESARVAICEAFRSLGEEREATRAAMMIARASRELEVRLEAAEWLELNGLTESAAAEYLRLLDDAWDTQPLLRNKAARRLCELGLAGCAKQVLEFLCPEREGVGITEAAAWLEKAGLAGDREAVPPRIVKVLAEAVVPQEDDDVRRALYRELVTQRLWHVEPNCSVPDSDVTTALDLDSQTEFRVRADDNERRRRVRELLVELHALTLGRERRNADAAWPDFVATLSRRFARLGSDNPVLRACTELCIQLRLLDGSECRTWPEVKEALNRREDLWKTVDGVERDQDDPIRKAAGLDGDTFGKYIRRFRQEANLTDDALYERLNALYLQFKPRGRATSVRRGWR
jgi:tetratricopeptide (TPR) repeat protein